MLEPILDQIYNHKELLFYLLGVLLVYTFLCAMEGGIRKIIREDKSFGLFAIMLTSWVFIAVIVLAGIFGKNEN